ETKHRTKPDADDEPYAPSSAGAPLIGRYRHFSGLVRHNSGQHRPPEDRETLLHGDPRSEQDAGTIHPRPFRNCNKPVPQHGEMASASDVRATQR
ncbi:hypothetical protein ABXK36_36885, partial [Bacillus cereus]|uniref:hypothetical protein n=1 Tax=Bacillus cereus TaxID=1396 RepID=UPI003601DFB4